MLKTEDLNTLRELFGIDGKIIPEVIQKAMEGMTPYLGHGYPKQVAGQVFWGELVMGIAEAITHFGDSGWMRKDTQNKPYLINKSLNKVIFFASGNEATGTPDNPKLKRIGTITKQMIDVNQNNLQKSLFPEPLLQEPQTMTDIWKSNDMEIWTLLYYLDKDAKTVQCEISKPVSCDCSKDYVWETRHILPIYEFAEPVILTDKQDKAEMSTGTITSSTTELNVPNVIVSRKESPVSENFEESNNK